MKRNIQSGHEILLDPQFGNVEGVPDVFRVHQQVDLPVHWNRHLGGHDIVFRILIVVVSIPKKFALASLIWSGGSGRTFHPGRGNGNKMQTVPPAPESARHPPPAQ
jgi:hypothetical protein